MIDLDNYITMNKYIYVCIYTRTYMNGLVAAYFQPVNNSATSYFQINLAGYLYMEIIKGYPLPYKGYFHKV